MYEKSTTLDVIRPIQPTHQATIPQIGATERPDSQPFGFQPLADMLIPKYPDINQARQLDTTIARQNDDANVFFIEAADCQRLTKNLITGESYPNASKVNSFHEKYK